jgi:hypothetical protein
MDNFFNNERIEEIQVKYLGYSSFIFSLIRSIVKERSYVLYPNSSKVRMNYLRRCVNNFRALWVLTHLMEDHLSPDNGLYMSNGMQRAVFGKDDGVGRFTPTFKYVCEELQKRGYNKLVWYRQGFGDKDNPENSVHAVFGMKSLNKLDPDKRKVNQKITEKDIKVVSEKVSAFFEYMKQTTGNVIPDSYKEFANNYYKYTIDMEEASEICKARTGYNFEEVKDYFKVPVHSANAKYFVMINALRDYSMCKSFSSGKFIVKMRHGRLYAPFHNLCKEYRQAFRYRKTGEKVVEVTDMKGAFVKGALCSAMCVSVALKDDKTASDICGIISNMYDPYKFMTDAGCDRTVAKSHVLRTLFSSGRDLRNRDRILANMKALDNEAVVKVYCENFLNLVDSNKAIKYLSNKELNKFLKNCTKDRVVFYTITGKMYKTDKSISFTNKVGKDKGNAYNLSTYIHLCELCLASIGQRMVFENMEKAYGKGVSEAVVRAISVFDAYNKNVLDKFSENVYRRLSRKDGLLPTRKQCPYELMNMSLICQNCEGEMMFEHVLPELKTKTGCNSMVSLHDAIFMPESFSKLVNSKDLAKTLDIKFYEAIVRFFMNNNACKEAVKFYKEKGME